MKPHDIVKIFQMGFVAFAFVGCVWGVSYEGHSDNYYTNACTLPIDGGYGRCYKANMKTPCDESTTHDPR